MTIYKDMRFRQQNTSRNAYPYKSLYVAAICFFARTGKKDTHYRRRGVVYLSSFERVE